MTSRWTAADIPSQTGRTAVVTGANSGLGLATARELARAGASVVLAVRNLELGAQAAESIEGDVTVRQLDLADLASVRAFADGWSGDLDVLVNNAGIMMVPAGRTADGFELQLGTNHLGHFALTNLLLPHVTDRVVTVSSGLHRSGVIDLDDLNWQRRPYNATAAYGQSKLANLLFTLELQRRLTAAGSPVRALAAHPGYSATRRFAEYHDLEGAFGRRATIERAKGILMERHSVDDTAAFDMLRHQSRTANRKLVDIAAAVVDGHPLLPKQATEPLD